MAGSFGGTIKLKGESEYRAALQKINQSLKETASETKLVASAFDKNDKSAQAMSAQMSALTNKLSAQESKISLLTGRYKEMQSVFDGIESEHKQLVASYEKEKSELERIEQTLGKTSKEYKEQKEVVDKLEKEVSESAIAYDKAEKQMSQMRTEINKAQTDANKTAKEMDNLGKETKEAGDSAKKASDGFTVMKGVMSNLISDALRAAVRELKEMATQVVQTGMAFDSAMSQVAATMGVTNDSIGDLRDFAKEMGANTVFSATQAAEALNYMALAGYDAQESMAMLPTVLDLAAAGGIELAQASDMVTDAQSAMGLSMEETEAMVDQMAMTSSKTNTSVAQLGEGILKIGATARNMKGGTAELAQVLGLLADNGIKGAEGGTHLRNILLSLQKAAKDGAVDFGEFSVQIYDAEGNMRDMQSIITEMAGGMANLTQESKDAMLQGIFNKTDLAAMNALLGTTSERWDEVAIAINNSAGAAERMASTQLDNLEGDVTLLKSQLEGIYITIYESLEPALRQAMKSLSEALGQVDWQGFGQSAGDAVKVVVDFFSFVLTHGNETIAIIGGIAGAFAGIKLAGFLTELGAIASILSPAGALIMGGAALAGVLLAVSTQTTEAEKAQRAMVESAERELDVVNKQHEAWEGLKQARDEMISSGMGELQHYENLYDELTKIVDENGKVQEGYEGRAQFITSTLAEALGVEIEYIDGVIQGYDTLKGSIEEVIAQKRAQIIIDAQQPEYAEAIMKQSEAIQNQIRLREELAEKNAVLDEAERKLTEAEIALNEAYQTGSDSIIQGAVERANAAQKEADSAKQSRDLIQQAYDQHEQEVNDYTDTIAMYEENLAKFHEGNYDDMATTLTDYEARMSESEATQKEILESELKTAQENLNEQKEAFDRTGSEINKKNAEQWQERVDETQAQLDAMNSSTESGLDDNLTKWNTGLANVLSEITGKNIEFQQGAEGNIQVYVDGISAGETNATNAMATVAQAAVDTADGYSGDFHTSGYNYALGMASGVSAGSSSVVGSISSMVSSMIATAKAGLQERSPSKAAREIGAFFTKGLAIGIVDEKGNLIKQVEALSKETLNTLNEAANVVRKVNAENAKKTEAEISKALASAAKTRVDELKKANKLTETEEVNFWQVIVNSAKKGTDGYNSAVARLEEAKQKLKSSLVKTTEEFVSDVGKLYDKLDKDLNKTNETFANQLKSRFDNIMGWFGTFDEVNLYKEDKRSKEQLIQNLQDQVDALEDYNSTMETLRNRIDNDDLFETLKNMGIQSLDDLKTLSEMSKTELESYMDLFKQKQVEAGQINGTLYFDAILEEWNKSIEDLTSSTEKEMKALREQYAKDIRAIGVDGHAESVNVGKMITAGIESGIKSGMASVKAEFKAEIQAMIDEVKDELEIKSPSRVFKDQVGKMLALGLGEGFKDEMKAVTKIMANSVPKQLDVTTTAKTGFESGSSLTEYGMVEAFKKALAEVKIELDGDTAGRFVGKTVTNLIYG